MSGILVEFTDSDFRMHLANDGAPGFSLLRRLQNGQSPESALLRRGFSASELSGRGLIRASIIRKSMLLSGDSGDQDPEIDRQYDRHCGHRG